jgi:hypothetical protein
MVLLRLLRVVLLLRRSLASVSTERIGGWIVSLVVVAVFVGAFVMWRVERSAGSCVIVTVFSLRCETSRQRTLAQPH